jgi:hypothetical protein
MAWMRTRRIKYRIIYNLIGKNRNEMYMKRLLLPIALLLGAVFFVLACTNEREVTLESLLLEMVDRDRMARYPSPEYISGQFSSYDRASNSPGEPGWYANADRSMFIREEMIGGRKEYVMFDTSGPGAVVRVWMTFAGENAGKGILRIYFDGDTIPEIQGTALDVVSGGLLTSEPLSSSVSELSPYDRRGHNLYLPLPYGKHCKISYESKHITNAGNKGNTGESVYYNINYRTYKQDLEVETFRLENLEKSRNTIQAVQKQLQERVKGIDQDRLEKTEFATTLDPGKIWSTDFSGSRAIRSISLRLTPDQLPRALRTVILEATFDGENTVWCPVGDFFGTGYQIRESNTWYSRVEENGTMRAYWVMPFGTSCSITFRNLGEEPIEIEGDLLLGDWKWDERSMHFGTSWHQLTKVFTRKGMTVSEPGSPFDVNYVGLNGKGVYIGDVLTLFNTSYMWWGEGDEKIYMDGESFPSHFGTGTEDYYGYAWGGRSRRFSNHPFIAQPDESGNASPGYVVNLRYRCLDAIPFQSQLKVDMELWHWHSTWMNYAPTSFYYLSPGGSSNISPDLKGALAGVALKSTDIISNVMTSKLMEAEHMSFFNSCGNRRGSMAINRFGEVPLSNHLHVLWRDGTPGDTITFIFKAQEEGVYPVSGLFSAGPEFGTFTLHLNGEPLRRIDLRADQPSGKTIFFGNCMIRQGENRFQCEVTGQDKQSHLFGMDCIRFD